MTPIKPNSSFLFSTFKDNPEPTTTIIKKTSSIPASIAAKTLGKNGPSTCVQKPASNTQRPLLPPLPPPSTLSTKKPETANGQAISSKDLYEIKRALQTPFSPSRTSSPETGNTSSLITTLPRENSVKWAEIDDILKNCFEFLEGHDTQKKEELVKQPPFL